MHNEWPLSGEIEVVTVALWKAFHKGTELPSGFCLRYTNRL
jgi:hypothetical protein